MCDCTTTTNTWHGTKKYRLADFFDIWWDTYMESPSAYVKPEQLKAVNAMRVCRTAVLGVEVYACEICGETTHVYHNCKNRFCPTCSWQDTVKWADKVKNEMLNIKHRHIVCTLPHTLHPLLKLNEEKLMGSLLRTAADTFKDWFEHKYNIKIGIISVLHTYGEQKEYHPHVHMIVSWGGINKKSGELTGIKEKFVKYGFLQKKFRCKFEDELVGYFDKDNLQHNFKDKEEFLRYLKQINRQDWVLHLEPPMDTPSEVVRYVGRYSKRACLSEYKITAMEGEYISFRYKDYRDRDENKKPKEKELTLHYRDFFPRLLQHVPPAYFRTVRYYGLYSNKGHIPKEYKCGPEKESAQKNWKEQQQNRTGENPLLCKTCMIEKVFICTVFDNRQKKERKNSLGIFHTKLERLKNIA